MAVSCDGCGACCMHIDAPPEYLYLLNAGSLQHLPADAVAALAVAAKRRDDPDYSDEAPCCWLDHSTMRCRWYEYRPQVCRTFEPGDIDCLGFRNLHNIPAVTAIERRERTLLESAAFDV